MLGTTVKGMYLKAKRWLVFFAGNDTEGRRTMHEYCVVLVHCAAASRTSHWNVEMCEDQ